MYVPYGKQTISKEDLKEVRNVLESDFLTQGPVVPLFESELAKYTGAKYGLAANSATSALHVACLALGVSEGDIVWTSPISFVASSNCALYCGAEIDFVDISLDTYNIDINLLESKLIKAESMGKLPKCVIPVHLAGSSCNMKAIYKLSKKYGFSIIEDASHAVGASYEGKPVGSCEYSDIAIFSFHPVKIITSGEGGMALTNSDSLIEKMALYRSHGITRDESLMKHGADGPWYYEMLELGFNYRMTDIAAALGNSQMKSLDKFVIKRNEIADRYDHLLKDLPFITPTRDNKSLSSFHLYIIRVDIQEQPNAHKLLFNKLRDSGIGVNLHYIPIYRQPFYKKFSFNKGDFVNSEIYYKSAISLPIYPLLTELEQDEVIKVLSKPSGYQNIF